MTLPEEPAGKTLIDQLLEEQQRLTAVDRFSRKHDANSLPSQSRYYRDLIPITKPQTGEQYAFAVDLDICTGCKACVSACHSLNGLDEDEIWRNVGLLHGGTVAEPYQQTITTACHHCVEPGCMDGCPVRAYEKDAETGIVRHLDDQCIGCQYCVLKCPYDVPKYSEKRGIVRKCDMCYNRLNVGEAPACVQACPSGAITIRTVPKEEIKAAIHPGDRLLPGAYESSYTKPTTSYTTRRSIPSNARPGDDRTLRLEHPHWPLIGMLVLSQAAAGIYLLAPLLLAGGAGLFGFAAGPLAVLAFVLLNLGLGVSVLHLGRPLGAWRAFLGLRTSWMSREIFAFSAFAAPAAALVATTLWEPLARWVPPAILATVERFIHPAQWSVPVLAVTAVLGVFSVFCSAMIYVDTHRVYWRGALTFPRFFGTCLVLGSAAIAATLAWGGLLTGAVLPAVITGTILAATALRFLLFLWEDRQFCEARRDNDHPDHRSALILQKLQRPLLRARTALLVVSMTAALVALFLPGLPAALGATVAFLSAMAAQVLDRYTFFTAVVAYRMPGPLASTTSRHA